MKETDLRILFAWALGLILALFFIINGWPKIASGGKGWNAQFESWGYTTDFVLVIGILEILGGVMVLIPRVAFYGAILLTVIMAGAVYTHLSTGIGSPALAIILLVLAAAQALVTKNRALLLS